ncbi:MAG: hypothetical protein ACLR3C_02925 [Eggerthella lenta]
MRASPARQLVRIADFHTNIVREGATGGAARRGGAVEGGSADRSRRAVMEGIWDFAMTVELMTCETRWIARSPQRRHRRRGLAGDWGANIGSVWAPTATT